MESKTLSGACLNSNGSLPIDTACFSVYNKNKHHITFFSTFDNCILVSIK